VNVNGAGNAYITGQTYSTNFPVTSGAFQTTCEPCNPKHYRYGNAFISQFNPTGSALVYSTYLGGQASDAGFGIAVNDLGNAFVAGYATSKNFPVTGAYQTTRSGSSDAFVTEINLAGSALGLLDLYWRQHRDFWVWSRRG
jgi:hypothetical protein